MEVDKVPPGLCSASSTPFEEGGGVVVFAEVAWVVMFVCRETVEEAGELTITGSARDVACVSVVSGAAVAASSVVFFGG